MGFFIVTLIVLAVGLLGLLVTVTHMRTLRAERDQIDKREYSGYSANTERNNDLRENTEAQHDTRIARRVATGVLATGVILLGISSLAIVPTRSIAVTIAMGKPTGTLGNGWHLIAPWESYEVYDATIQTPEDAKLPTFQTRIANGAVAEMQVSVDWQVDPSADIRQLHLDWRSFDRLSEKVVNPRLRDALNKEFEGYDPLVSLKQSGGQAVSLGEMEKRVLDRLNSTLPQGLLIRRLQIPMHKFPPHVQKALDDYQAELANTQIATQQRLTAEQQRLAIDELAKGGHNTEFLQCLTMTERLAQQGKTISTTWSCVPGGNAAVTVPTR